ncbi:MAG: stage II sporulation protein P [Clostridia bacterium]|nr:stage II sporulation protein P [Clostridia bacterium]
MNKRSFLGLAAILTGLFALTILGKGIDLPFQARSASSLPLDIPELGLWEEERTDGSYFTIVDEKDRILDKTARTIYPGDEFIAQDNRHYRVERVEENRALAILISDNALQESSRALSPVEAIPIQTKNNANKAIALYHTHSDESYLPTEGTESIPGEGGIFKVGEKLAAKLEEKGIRVIHDTTPHEPHDAGAYRRSRRTALNLLKEGPAAIIDIHRDGVPDPDFYHEQVTGVDVAQIRMVVGRQNANMQSNLDFAKKIKAELDEYYPGLIKGIFLAKGNYNQDLSPRSILLEVGTYTNDRRLAEKGIHLFGDAIPVVLGITGGKASSPPDAGGTQADWSSLWILLGLALVGGGLFLLVSTGSLKGSLQKLKQLSSSEWKHLLRAPSRKGAPLTTDGPEDKKEGNDEEAG